MPLLPLDCMVEIAPCLRHSHRPCGLASEKHPEAKDEPEEMKNIWRVKREAYLWKIGGNEGAVYIAFKECQSMGDVICSSILTQEESGHRGKGWIIHGGNLVLEEVE